MSHRRKHRWLRRLALGLAFASIVSPAGAKIDEGATGSSYVTAGGWAGYVDPATGVPLSAGIAGFESQVVLGEDVKSKAAAHAQTADPYLTDVAVRQGESLGGPDGAAQPFAQVGTQTFVQGVTDFPRPGPTAAWNAEQPRPVINYLSHGMAADGEVGARPDDRADRFTPGDGVSTPRVEVAGSSRDWDGLLTIGLGAVALGLALGLAFGYLRRPRLAL